MCQFVGIRIILRSPRGGKIALITVLHDPAQQGFDGVSVDGAVAVGRVVLPIILAMVGICLAQQAGHARFNAVAGLSIEGADGVQRGHPGCLAGGPAIHVVKLIVTPCAAVIQIGVPVSGEAYGIGLSGFSGSRGSKGRSRADAHERGECHQNRKKSRHSPSENVLFHIGFIPPEIEFWHEKSAVFLRRFSMWYKVLCVPDVDQILVCADAFVPDPDICDALVLGISLQTRVNVSLQIDAALLCGNRIVPAIGCRAIQGQPQAHRRAFCVRNPVFDIKCGLGLRSRLRLGYRRNGRFLFRTFCFLRLLRKHGCLPVFLRCRRIRFCGCAYRLRRKARAAIVLVLIWYASCWIGGFCRGFCGSVWFCGYRLKGSRRFFLWRWSFRCVSCCLPLQWLCGASGKQYGKQERAQYKKLFHGMTSNDCFFSYCTNALGFLQLCRLYIFLLSWYCR